VSQLSELVDFRAELLDRFGQPPPPVLHLLELAEIRIAAHSWQITSIHLEDLFAVFTYVSGRKIRQLAEQNGGRLRVVDNQSAYLPLSQEVMTPAMLFSQIKSLLRPE
jgi:transcription-repair coupling factor (superfamily II helicase)